MLLFGRQRKSAIWSNKYKKKEEPEANSGIGERARVVDLLLKKMEAKLSGADTKASLGDYVRLVQLRRELEDEQPREIKVSWIEPGVKESDSGE